jgi:hypothetical protein
MSNGTTDYPASPGPDFALRESDAEEMRRALRGATSSRAAGMAHRVAEREMKRTDRQGRRGKRSTRR